MNNRTLLFIFLLLSQIITAQNGSVSGFIRYKNQPVSFANITLAELEISTQSDTEGYYNLTDIPMGTHQIQVSAVGFKNYTGKIVIDTNAVKAFAIQLT